MDHLSVIRRFYCGVISEMKEETRGSSMKQALVGILWFAGCALLAPAPARALNLDINDVRVVHGQNAADDTVAYRDYDASAATPAWSGSVQVAPDPASNSPTAQIKWAVPKISHQTGQHLLGLQYTGNYGGGYATYLNFLL